MSAPVGWSAPPPASLSYSDAPPMAPPSQTTSFFIQNVETGLVLHIRNEHPNSGGEVIMEQKTGHPAQLWTYKNNAICSALNESVVLDVADGTGPNVITYQAHFGPNQQWEFNEDSSTVVSSTGEVLDIEGGSTERGAQVIVWDEHGGPNQKFVRVYV